MTTKVVVPTLGESITSASIANWNKKIGDSVSVDETLLELETEKVSVEVPSPIAGIIESIDAQQGQEVEIGALLCTINENAKAANKKQPAQESEPQESEPKEAQDSQEAQDEIKASPAAAKLAREHNVNINELSPSGPKGHVLKEDVKTTSSKSSTPKNTTAPITEAPTQPQYQPLAERPTDERGEERIRMSKLRKVIATRLKEAQNQAALLTTFNEVNMTALMEIRKNYRESFEKKHNAKLGFMSFFVKAVVYALQEFPSVNAEIYGDEIIYKNYYDIGIAVGSPQGLVVPVLRDADQKNFAEIENTIADFARRSREGKLTIADMSGGTFTITNGGVYGSLLSTPIINPPQSGILGMHKIQKRPFCQDNEIIAAPLMYLAHSYDHRIIDGREAVTFLVRIKELLEDPARLLLNI